jgi:hypothetical protein
VTLRVPKSKLDVQGVSAEQFGSLVADHARNLLEHALHMKRVAAEDASRPAIVSDSLRSHLDSGRPEGSWAPPPRAHVGYPPPPAPPLVDQAVRRPDFVPDFEVFDDGPTPAQKLRAAKDALLVRVGQLEGQAVAAVLPAPGKQRAEAIRERDLRAGAVLSSADEAFLEERDRQRARLEEIERHAAAMASEVEDLPSVEEAGRWQPRPFGG